MNPLCMIAVAVAHGVVIVLGVICWQRRFRPTPPPPELSLAEGFLDLLLRCPGLVMALADSVEIQGQVLYDPEKGELSVMIYEEPTSDAVVEYRHPLAAPDSIEWLQQKLAEVGFVEYSPSTPPEGSET